MLTHSQLNQLASYTRSRVVSMFDPAQMFAESDSLRKELESAHRGFFVGVVDHNGNELCRSGFLKEDQKNIRDSAEMVVKGLFSELQSQNVTVDIVRKATFHFTIVNECIYMPDPTVWNENSDGIYFMWGQRYKAMYLPYQIRRLNMSKIDIMDRLCMWEAGVASNLWRLPCGLMWRLVCQSHTS